MKKRSFKTLAIAICLYLGLCVIIGLNNRSGWEDSIKNPANHEYVVETAFNNGNIPLDQVTQDMFNERYCNGNSPAQLHEIWSNKFNTK